ncbi:TIGR03086 family metal-binding protein [Actinoplanes sp. NPDC023801]|uniref:TIGR03086 family metal-binding protein n=1 Tax=Actinoplanes sp. NPDC023801 TaxID=3154595 RepID=UPI0033D6D58F
MEGLRRMSLAELSPADRHRRIATDFTARVEGTKDWDAPAPVAGWTARDVVRHLVEWLPGFLSSGAAVTLPQGPNAGTDPAGAWHAHATAVQELLDDPGTAGRTLSNPHLGEIPLDQAIDRFYTTDVFMHTWDLARATGQDERLEPALCADLMSGMEPMDEMLRASGQFGPAVPVPAGADPQTRLIGFIGRDPNWSAPH